MSAWRRAETSSLPLARTLGSGLTALAAIGAAGAGLDGAAAARGGDAAGTAAGEAAGGEAAGGRDSAADCLGAAR